ncbi:MAG: T9SS type A sorting domain-containing protein [Bacteroidales bacterium]|nr:T9SS type A sorting domain-containing protein [Bacteroidales bacterium]
MVNIYPNPTKDFINIETGNDKPLKFKIYNISGYLIKTEYIISKGTIDLSYLPAGVYFMESYGLKTKIIKY